MGITPDPHLPTEQKIPPAETPSISSSQALSEVGGALSRLARSLLQEGREAALETGQDLQELVEDGKGAALQKGREVKKKVEKSVGEALDKIGANPDQQKGIISELVRILPGIGPTASYADAWKIWQVATETGDESLKQIARTKCLLAIADAGIDVALLGSKAISGVAKVARRFLVPLLTTRAARFLGAADADPIKSLVEDVAKTQPAKSIAEYLLTRVNPKDAGKDLQAQAPVIEKDLDGIVDVHAKDADAPKGE